MTRYIALLVFYSLIITKSVAFLPSQISDGRGNGIGTVQRTATPVLGKIPNLQKPTAISSAGVKKPLDTQTVLHMSASGGAEESFKSFSKEKISLNCSVNQISIPDFSEICSADIPDLRAEYKY